MSEITRPIENTIITTESAKNVGSNALRFAWMEVTGKCPLKCLHCYAKSGPNGTHGTMTTPDWMRAIDEVADLGADTLQFIGGEPTQHPDLVPIAQHALDRDIQVEVFTNMVALRPEHWGLFTHPDVTLATSYYSDDPEEHDRITKGPNSHRQTTKNIAKAVELGTPPRVGLIRVEEGQRVTPARLALEAMGVTNINYDDLRQVGRGERDKPSSVDELCGKCTDGSLAISPTGEVWPCVFARGLLVGNVHNASLTDIWNGAAFAEVRDMLNREFAKRPQLDDSLPDTYDPLNTPQRPPCAPFCAPRCIPTVGPTKCQPANCKTMKGDPPPQKCTPPPPPPKKSQGGFISLPGTVKA